MSKIFDALEHAETERLSGDFRPAQAPSPMERAEWPTVPATVSPLDMQDEMAHLYQQVDVLLPDPSRLLQFIGSQAGEGTSTIVREFARVAATRFGQRVLLLAMEPRASSGSSGIVGVEGSPAAVLPSRVGQTSLHIASLPHELAAASRWLDRAPATTGFWGPLRRSFDLIVIDALPVVSSPESLTIAGQADGVIFVLEAERTSALLAERSKDSVERSGGRMLGMVFNKRRQHVPGFLEQRLT